jgi:hypothetical protein
MWSQRNHALKRDIIMSFALLARGSTKAEAQQDFHEKLTAVIEQQPIHETDEGAIGDAVDSYFAMLDEDESQDVQASVNGYIGTLDDKVVAVSIGITVSVVAREPQG